jgi:hypothetical protein
LFRFGKCCVPVRQVLPEAADVDDDIVDEGEDR